MMLNKGFYQQSLEAIKKSNRYREAKVYAHLKGAVYQHEGSELVNFSSNSYLGLHLHPEMIRAADKASQLGTSASASRLVSGTLDLHEQLEESVREWKKAEAAMVFNSGFQANCGIIQAIADKDTVIFADRLVHASIIDGIRLSNASFQRFKHNDIKSLTRLLDKFSSVKKKMIISETVFSMDGDESPIADLVEVSKKHHAFLYLDDAHGAGVYGDRGRGPAAEFEDDIDLLLGTFSKALGSFGAYAVMSQTLKEYLVNTCRSYIFSTALPPTVLAANLKSVELLQTDELDKQRGELMEKSYRLRQLLESKNYDIVEAKGPIIAIVMGDESAALTKSEDLKDRGFLVPAIRPPTVPKGTSRLRLTLSTLHSEKELNALIDAF